jgi:hypothetical protein
MDPVTVLPIPSEPWLHRLRKGHVIWLVKEQQIAQVNWEWEPPEPGHISGRLGIQRFDGTAFIGRRYRGDQTWFIGSKGEGLDGKQLIAPVEGNLPYDPPPIPEPEIRQILRALESQARRIEKLESILDGFSILGDLYSYHGMTIQGN